MPTTRLAVEDTTDPMWPGHDPFTCECHETCSWCVEPVLDSSLRTQPDGARICGACLRELREATAARSLR